MVIDKYVITTKDQLGIQSLVVYTDLKKCNLNCIGCHNKKDNREYKFLTKEEFKELTTKAKMLGCELCIISGGEPTLNEINALADYIKLSQLPVRLDTNGTFPERLSMLISLTKDKLIGVALDIKIPFSFNKKNNKFDLRFYSKVLGLSVNNDLSANKLFISDYVNSVKTSLLFILHSVKDGILHRDYCITRTVLYGGEEYKKIIKESLNEFYSEVNLPKLKHYFLDFVDDNYKFKKDSNINSIIDYDGNEIQL